MRDMATIRDVVGQLAAGIIPVDLAAKELQAGVWPRPRTPAKTVLESYRRADEIPDDNDPYWIDEALSSHRIDRDAWKQLRDALRASWRATAIGIN